MMRSVDSALPRLARRVRWDEEVRVAAIAGPWGAVEVARDAWGTPRWAARSRDEAVWITGWLHARDRLVQARLALAIAQGGVTSLVGDVGFARRVDRATSQLGFQEGLTEALEAMESALRRELSLYGEGFQAGARARGRPWPLRLLGLDLPAWGPREALLVHRVLCWFGLTSLTQLAKAALGELITRGASPTALAAVLGPGAEGLDAGLLEGLAWPTEELLVGPAAVGGSNAFAVSGARSRSGGALVMASFHLEVGRLPPVLYPVDIAYPDGEIEVGMTVPGVPHILAGRNRRVAWAYTFGHADNVDLTVERCVEGGVEVDGVVEPVRLRGVLNRPRRAQARAWSMYDLPNGAALLGAPEPGQRRVALRWRGLEDPAADHLVLFRTRRARDVAELVALHRGVRTLSCGAVFGDADGRIAWMHTGRVAAERAGWGPRRRSKEDPDLPESARPVEVDPERGFVAAGNEGCAGWTAFPEPRYRRQRMDQLLAAPGPWDLDRVAAVVYDDADLCAARLVPAWARLLPGLPASMVAWAAGGCRVTAAPDQARAFHRLHHVVSREVLTVLLGRELAGGLVDHLGLLLSFQDALDDVLAGERPDLVDEASLAGALARAWPAVASMDWGPDVGAAPFKNMVADTRLSALVGLNTRPVPFPGSPTSLFQSRRLRLFGQEMIGGPAFHLLMDMGTSATRYNVAGGASEQRFGPGYGAGLTEWSTGGFLPLGPR